MPPPPLIPLATIDTSLVVAGLEAIRRVNPHRHEMELLTRVCHADAGAGEIAGVYEVPAEPFWARGHIPGRPIMPGVLMLEAAAQLCSFGVHLVIEPGGGSGRFFGLGRIDGAKFRGVILPGQELLLLGRATDVRSRRAVFQAQGWVAGRLCFETGITGMWV
jgi:3-hydroxyacyl-[acyl-carrier-protein] dehydratase